MCHHRKQRICSPPWLASLTLKTCSCSPSPSALRTPPSQTTSTRTYMHDTHMLRTSNELYFPSGTRWRWRRDLRRREKVNMAVALTSRGVFTIVVLSFQLHASQFSASWKQKIRQPEREICTAASRWRIQGCCGWICRAEVVNACCLLSLFRMLICPETCLEKSNCRLQTCRLPRRNDLIFLKGRCSTLYLF